MFDKEFGKVLSVDVDIETADGGRIYEVHHYIECPFKTGFLKIEQECPSSGGITVKKINRNDFPYLEEWNAKFLIYKGGKR